MTDAESHRDPFKTHRLRQRALLLVGVVFLLALLANLVLASRLGELRATRGAAWHDVFPVEDPQFRGVYRESLGTHLVPWRVGWGPAALAALLVLLPLGFLAVYWYRGRSRSLLALLPALLPVLLGLVVFPFQMLGMVDSYPLLVEQGLLNPMAFGSGVGRATAPVALGLGVSLICLAVMWLSAPRRFAAPGPAGSRSARRSDPH